MTGFNLLREAWIPAVLMDGTRRNIGLADIMDPSVKGPDWPRPDFNLATWEFLIGFVQTAMAPRTETDWCSGYHEPPSDRLKTAIAKYAPAFELVEGPARFMQEFAGELSAEKTANQMFFEAPGDNTLKLNKDFFIKRGEDVVLGLDVMAIALFTRQIYENGFGGGYRGTLRGPGAIVSLIRGENLWQSIWLNVAPAAADAPIDATVFPWLGPTKTSEKGTLPTLAQDIHPMQVFWPMPSRMMLDVEEGEWTCSMTGKTITRGVRRFFTQQYGINYEDEFRHPLSPFMKDADKFRFRRGRELTGSGSTYRSFADITLPYREGSKNHPALVVERYVSERRKNTTQSTRIVLSVSGFDFAQANAKAFNQSQMPIFAFDGGQTDAKAIERKLGQFQKTVDELIAAAESAKLTIHGAVLRACYGEPSSGKSGYNWKFGEKKSLYGSTFGEQVEEEFWHSTESGFYACVEQVFDALNSDEKRERLIDIKLSWLKLLQQAGKRIFDESADGSDFQQKSPKAIVLARQEMTWFLNGTKIYESLGLQKPETKKGAA
ncbi:MAG: type I-E CRISPR-associated protein Cse1/CasA [bacterium]